MRKVYSKDQIEIIVKENYSIAECLRKLSLRPAGGNYKWFNRIIKFHQIDISHFTGQGWSFGKKLGLSNRGKCLNEILVQDSTYGNSNHLRQKLIAYGLKEKKCEKCKNTEWNGLPIPLELEHANGNNVDNRIENLLILCPNCHAQTPSYRGRNKLSNLNERRELNRVKFGEPSDSGNPEPSLKKKFLRKV